MEAEGPGGSAPLSMAEQGPRRIGEGKQTHDISLEWGLPQHTAWIAPSWNKVNSNHFFKAQKLCRGNRRGCVGEKTGSWKAGRQTLRVVYGRAGRCPGGGAEDS